MSRPLSCELAHFDGQLSFRVPGFEEATIDAELRNESECLVMMNMERKEMESFFQYRMPVSHPICISHIGFPTDCQGCS